ncbi:hypothetical protein JCM10295v2_001877 [Rhodotorula toruloides]
MTPPLELGKAFPTENDFQLAAWTQAGQEGFRWTNHGNTKNSLTFRCCEAHVARSDKDDRRGCMKGADQPRVVVRLNIEHTCDPEVRNRKIDSHREHAKEKCEMLREELHKVQLEREKKRKRGTSAEDESATVQETQVRTTLQRRAKKVQPEEEKAHTKAGVVLQPEGVEDEEAGHEALDKEVPYPRPREIREFIDECLENGQTVLPLPNDKFDCAVDILAQLFAYAEVNKIDFKLEIQRNEHGVWTLAEKVLHHKREHRPARTINAIRQSAAGTRTVEQGAEKKAAKEGQAVVMLDAERYVVLEEEKKGADRREKPHEMEVEKAEEEIQADQVGPKAPKYFTGTATQGAVRVNQFPSSRTPYLATSTSSSTTSTANSAPCLSKPSSKGITADLLPNLSKPQLVLLVNKLLIGKGGITSVSRLARLAAFEGASLEDFVKGYKLGQHKINGIDYSPLVQRFVNAFKTSLAETHLA